VLLEQFFDSQAVGVVFLEETGVCNLQSNELSPLGIAVFVEPVGVHQPSCVVFGVGTDRTHERLVARWRHRLLVLVPEDRRFQRMFIRFVDVFRKLFATVGMRSEHQLRSTL